MPKTQISTKRLAISKANAQMVAVVAIAAFISVFCLVAAKTALSSNSYTAKVVSAKEKAHRQLTTNVQNASSLVSSYQKFVSAPTNVIGGSSTGSGDNDGDNAKITLDALPSSYDFPALASSLEKILNDRNLKVGSITGTDDQLNQQGNVSSGSPQPVPIPFTFSITHANYDAVQQLISTLQSSIRPIQIDSLNLSGGNNNMKLTVMAHTYYQPGKTLQITKQVVK